MDVRIVYLLDDFESKKGDIRLVGHELAQQLVKSEKACYYADFKQSMLEDESLSEDSKKKVTKKG